MGPLIFLLLLLPAQATEAPALPGSDSAAAYVTLVAVGDIRLDGPVGAVAKSSGASAPSAGVREWLRGDIVLGNLETSITKRGHKADKRFNFRAPSASLGILKAAGFTALNLANNHVMDYGPQGLSDTLAALSERGFIHFGAGPTLAQARKPVYLTVHGVRVGFMGLTSTLPDFIWAKSGRPGVAYSDFKRFPDWIAAAKAKCDVLVLSFHGGLELAAAPHELQRAFGRAAVDAGADLVLAHHPHVVQPAEVYRGKVILHSLGNFLFVSPSPKTRWSVIVRAKLSQKGVESVELVPVDTGWGRMAPATEEGAEIVRQALDLDGALSAHPELLRFQAGGLPSGGSR